MLDAAPDLVTRAADLDARYGGLSTEGLLTEALRGAFGRVAVVSSFGADSAVLLHLVAQIDRAAPVLFLDTGKHFPQTLAYRDRLAAHLGLTGLRVLRPGAAALAAGDPAGDLHDRDPAACCDLRKSRPLDAALSGFDGWISGRKRAQSTSRASLAAVEAEPPVRLKLNPLRDWTQADLRDYARAHRLPAHPLLAEGYPSIGCAACTTPVTAGEDPRAGRWRGRGMTECGIHMIGGRMVRDKDRRIVIGDHGPAPEAEGVAPLVLAADAAPDTPEGLAETLAAAPEVIEITFPAFSDGRGFTLGRQLRAAGFRGRLRAAGPLLPDQYPMARRCGFDEIALPPALFQRQGGAAVWASRLDWQAHDHRARLAG